MKLRNKALIVIAITWILFFIACSSVYIRASLLSFTIMTVFFAALCVLACYYTIIKSIERLKIKLQYLKLAPPYDQRLSEHGDEEIKVISAQVNRIIQAIQTNAELYELQMEDRTRSLHKKNIQLQQEISDRISLERKMAAHRETITRLAHYDNLTSLPNRIFFNEILNKSMNHAKRHKKILAILFVDIDNFNEVNSQLGHTVGDYILKEVGNRLASTLRGEDILARLDGDEFIVLLNDIGKAKFASSVAEKLLKACAQTLRIENREIAISASIGIAIFPHDGEALEELLRHADSALAQAKHQGGNAYQFYSATMDVEAHEFIQLEAELRKAVKNNELMLFYQPKLNIRKGSVCGVEALIRWMHPELGSINPATLISLAEDTGLINQIGEWALREACLINKYWQEEGYEHLTIAVNISPKQFHHPDLAKVVAGILKETGLNPRYLELEINETTIMDDITSAAQMLNELKAIGVIISIDHFGTGYTSISQLKQFPISILKIDRNFIKGIPQNPNDDAIVNAFISLAHNLGLEVIAEGVETAEQVQYLAIQNCDMVQGYFLSHPLPAGKITGQFTKLRDEVLI